MKKFLTICLLISMVSLVKAQEAYFDIPIQNGDFESTELDGFTIFAAPPGVDRFSSESGLVAGAGVDGSQAVRVGVLSNGTGWHVQFRTENLDFRPTGAGSYILSYQMKADSAFTEEKWTDGHPFWHTVAMYGGGNFKALSMGNISSKEEVLSMHEGYITVTDTFELPATQFNNDGDEFDIENFVVNIQMGKYGHSFLIDNYTLRGPESFYDISFKVFGIVEGDTSVLEGAEVIVDGLDYDTDTAGVATAPDLKLGSYDWSVSADGFATQSGSKAVSAFETVNIYLEEADILGFDKNISVMTYPNPATNKVQFLSEKSKIVTIELHTLTGALIDRYSPLSKKYSLDVSSFKTGIYLVKVINENGEQYSDRLIIKR